MNITMNRFRYYWQLCCMLALVFTSHQVQAVVACNAVATLPASAYDASTAVTTTGSVTVTCTRAASDPSDTSVGYVRSGGTGVVTYAIGADGVNTGNTIAVSGVNQLNYSLFRPPSFTTVWSVANVTAGTVSFGTGQTSASSTTSFTMNVPAGRWNSPAGLYTELVTVFLIYGTTNSTNSFTNSVTVSPICTIPTPPGDLNFGTYNSLTAGPALVATSPFQIRCTRGVVYSFGFDVVTSTIPGVDLNYTLTSPAGGTSPNAAVNLNIVGSMPSGQSGTCSTASCVGSQPRTLILSY
jgi:spore coat protein U-like protein